MKPWYKRKTLWAGVVLIFTGIGEVVASGDYAKGAEAVLAGLGLIFLREAVEQVK